MPRNATYTSTNTQNELIVTISAVVTEGIKQEIGNFWYTIKVDSTKDPTDVEKIYIVIHVFNEHSLKVVEHLLILLSTDSGDAKPIRPTDVIFAELRFILGIPHFRLGPHHLACSGDGAEFTSLDIFPTFICEATTSERRNNENGITITSRQTSRNPSLMTFGLI